MSTAHDLAGFSESERARPPSPAELRRRDSELAAVAEWYETGDLEKVAQACGARSRSMAQVVLNRGIERYEQERVGHLARVRTAQDMDLERVLVALRRAIDGGDLRAADRIVRVHERRSRLYGADLDPQRAEGPTVVVIASRPPWERGETVSAGEPEPPPAAKMLPSGEPENYSGGERTSNADHSTEASSPVDTTL